MGDESSVEKFVLEYQANTAETLRQLEALSAKIDEIHDKGKKTGDDVGGLSGDKGKKIRDGIKDITSHFEGMVPGLDKVSKLTDLVGKRFVAATVALAAFAVIMKAVNNLQNQYEIQRITGSQVGLSAAQVNQYQQQFNAANGRMTSDKSRELLGKVSQLTSAAYTNPDPYNREALQLRNAGVGGAFDKNGQIKSTDTVLNEMTKKFKAVSAVQAEAIGMSIGLTMDEVQAIRNRNTEAENSIATSESARRRQAEANKAMERLGSDSGKLSEQWRQISDTVGQVFVPIIADAVHYIQQITEGLPEALDKGLTAFQSFDSQFQSMVEFVQQMPLHLGNLGEFWDQKMKEADDRIKNRDANNGKLVEDQNAVAQQGYKTQKEFERNVNLFASSVGSFAGVIDERQAWAAWAGSIGQAGGVSGLGTGQPGAAAASGGGNANQFGGYGEPASAGTTGYGNKNGVDTYDAELKEVWGKDWEIGKAIMMVESSGDPNAKNPKSTATGLMQVLQSQKDFVKPGENPYDAHTSIVQAKRVWDAKIRATKGDVDKAIMRYGENTPEYLNKVKQYLPRQKVIDATTPASVPYLAPAPAPAVNPAPVPAPVQSVPGPVAPAPVGPTPTAPTSPVAPTPAPLAQGTVSPNERQAPSPYTAVPKPNIYAESRQSAQMSMVADAVAERIGVTRQQMMTGGISKSDISFAVRNIEFEAKNNLQRAQAMVKAPVLREGQRAQAATELRNAQDQLRQIQTYGKTLIGRGYGREEDKRVFTSDRPDKAGMVVNVNIYGVHDAHEFKRDALPALTQGIKDANNHSADGVSH